MTLNADDRDRSVDPGTDFYRFANGGWIDSHPIPPGHGSWGAFEELAERNEAVVLDLLDHARTAPDGDLDRALGDYFASGLDTEAIEAAGTTPITSLLAPIDAVRSVDDVLLLLPDLHRAGVLALFAWSVTVDHDDSTHNLFWLAQGGLGLPDRDSYDATDDAAVSLRAAYADHVALQLTNLGESREEAGRLAAGVLDLETRLAGTHLTRTERRDLGLTLNRHTLAELDELAPALGLPRHLRALGAAAAETVNVQSPTAFRALHQILRATDVDVLRAYLRFHVVRATADALSSAFDEASFSFYGKRIRGLKEQRERRKRVVDALTADMGEALAQRFVADVFPASAKERAQHMVEAILDEMRASLRSRSWMSEETRDRGLVKLAALRVKIGYPDTWRDWSGLEISRESYAANRMAATRFEVARLLSKLDEPVDQTEWEMPPHVVNAYYHPTRNEIVFPAGILQPPFFDADADDAVNFGGIGAVIAHEITHGFDDQGRRFDHDGAFRDWWTPTDEAGFTALADRLASQFDDYVVLDDVHVNGRLTLGENIADLGGLALSSRAHARVSEGAPDVGGLTPSQRFWLAHATIWRARISEELQRTLVQVDSHAPRHLRVNGPFSNLDAFAQAWDVAPDAPMMRAPEDRLEIW